MADRKKPVKKVDKISETVNLGERSYKFDYIRKSKFAVIISLTFIVAGLVMFLIRGFNFGIDFIGGNLMEIKFTKSISITELRDTMGSIVGNAILQNTEEISIVRTIR